MEFDHILIRYGELALKGKNQKKFLIQLQQNIRSKLKQFPNVSVKRSQGRMFIVLHGENPYPIMDICKTIFGIHSLSLAIKTPNDLTEIKNAALYALQNAGNKETFKVSVKRINKGFPVHTMELNQILGGHLLTNTSGHKVDVHHPDVTIKVEIRAEATYVTSSVLEGAGGLPVGTSGKSLLMLSGGIDSPVAGYLTMKRGVDIEAVHFHSPPFTSERAKQKVIDLAEKLTAFGHKIKIHMVPFTKLQQKIFQDTPNGYSMTVMRRAMFRISEAICRREGILSITTGENLGQVASQTMESMHAINDVTNYPILRPLISMDKQEIIRISKDIATYDISIRPYEDCCTIFVPKAPKTKPKRDRARYYEEQLGYDDMIQEALNHIETVVIENNAAEKQDSFDGLL
ncbi:tRNA uracil 4-sulfurtransferase ThiI [Virgibacillus sp. 179-BFC.A HS]|uniref:Probable tRNA sulfurtransferase n=1 Tax=Tigheibacillus jepli TaxID=3035914 RepID=A0ABU5CH86_9BACI|nr:tRNA uracil 4-sulfurtransferase ThiI [Virgibacillus sp. 179-BFC.A HS]MDY0405326.1 tRNA uracil 4-sulfurtransferase ThiI [Virgibacillus sp. 179-BFC.A HS]